VDEYARALEGETAALSCDQGYLIQLVRVTFGDGYRTQTCSDPTAMDRLIPYCDKQQTCNVTIDSNIFPNSSCSASITGKFQAVWFCRYGMLILDTIFLQRPPQYCNGFADLLSSVMISIALHENDSTCTESPVESNQGL